MHRLLLALALLATSGFRPATPPEQRNAIVISWDGAGGEHVRANLAKGKLPNLATLVRQGAMVDLEVTGHGTDTKPGHAQMLTGYDPGQTGVYSNGKFGPIPRGYSVFERLQQTFGKSLVTIMLTGKGANLGSLRPEAGPAEPFYFTRQALTIWDGDTIRSARSVGERAVHYLALVASKHRFLLFIHFPDVDVGGHYHGEDSSDYDRALTECDDWLGKIMAELEAEKVADRTLVYVTADHGFDKARKRHSSASHIFLATNDARVTLAGEQRDVAPTVLSAMGIDLTRISPRLPGKVLAK